MHNKNNFQLQPEFCVKDWVSKELCKENDPPWLSIKFWIGGGGDVRRYYAIDWFGFKMN